MPDEHDAAQAVAHHGLTFQRSFEPNHELLARSGAAEHYSSTDIGLLADLIVSFVVTMAERLVEDPDSEARTLAQARTQLRMLLVGAINWRSPEPG